ncbi:phosphatase PAP2 family protein [Xylophilus ampelinus]|uniref:Undecaprenyl-diphosphatase n=1 Tax=Xylophilus ampelinus TaxID=54067 RepID=A0A318SKP0_9BURK|nr:phosphatase PAP2 family protein [Xylophilus ampelinus]MCS4510913.1 phosphatase PAP2 family protein [Xylophilus ampelinus]PYE76072.1 undecaprenyl-diphosphatase [Xylophilus ampelinus]
MAAAPTDWVALATQAGLHAWPAFLVLLAIALAGAGAATAWLTPHDGQHAPPRTAPRGRYLRTLGGSLAAGGVVVLATAAAFAAVARLLGDGRTLQRADEALSLHVTAETPTFALAAFRWLTYFGEPLVLIVMGIAVAMALWTGQRRGLALGWIAATAGNAVLNPALKQIFLRARPLYDGMPSLASGYSFPSGHSSGAMVTYGMLAYLAWRLIPPRWHVPASMLAAAIVLTTACSRIFLQVHFASDVLAGLCSGAAWLAVCIASCEYARHHRLARR